MGLPWDGASRKRTLSRTTVVGSTDRGATLSLTVTPSEVGEIDHTWVLRGTALRLGYDVIGSPVRIRLRGRVGPTPAEAAVPVGWLEGGAVVVVLALVVWVARRGRTARTT